MSNLGLALQGAASQNHELLARLAATDYAPSSLKQNNAFIDDVKNQIQALSTELRRLHGITEAERKDHISYRDSSFKRWMSKMHGPKGEQKFTAQQETEEREFHDAWHNERSAQESRDELLRTLKSAEEEHERIAIDVQRQEKAQNELDALYHSIFDGPTPEFPGEDLAEEAVNAALGNLAYFQEQLKNDKSAMPYMQRCSDCMKTASLQLDEALKYSRMNRYDGNTGSISDYDELDSVRQVQQFVSITNRHLATARKFQPEIGQLGDVRVQERWDAACDRFFRDVHQESSIVESMGEMKNAVRGMEKEVELHKQRTADGERRVKQARADVEEARKELQRARAEAFEQLASTDGGEAPPVYSVN